ncbi:MAG: flagellar hook-length control protein FliK [Rhodobacteraceae bacterium]|nr:flagellar hook-length control protein FliK [Paracoccaceae bacterium]
MDITGIPVLKPTSIDLTLATSALLPEMKRDEALSVDFNTLLGMLPPDLDESDGTLPRIDAILPESEPVPQKLDGQPADAGGIVPTANVLAIPAHSVSKVGANNLPNEVSDENTLNSVKSASPVSVGQGLIAQQSEILRETTRIGPHRLISSTAPQLVPSTNPIAHSDTTHSAIAKPINPADVTQETAQPSALSRPQLSADAPETRTPKKPALPRPIETNEIVTPESAKATVIKAALPGFSYTEDVTQPERKAPVSPLDVDEVTKPPVQAKSPAQSASHVPSSTYIPTLTPSNIIPAGAGLSDFPAAISQVELSTTTQTMTATPRGAPVVHQIVDQIAVRITMATEPKIELRLDPPELGRVTIQLISNDSVLQAIIIAERPEISDLMRRHADILTAALEKAGFAQTDLQFQSGQHSGENPDREEESSNTPANALTNPQETLVNLPYISGGSLDIRL